MVPGSTLVLCLFQAYDGGMDVERDELIALIAEALLSHPGFRPRRRTWIARQREDTLHARTCAVAIVDHLGRCGLQWRRRAPVIPHSAGE